MRPAEVYRLAATVAGLGLAALVVVVAVSAGERAPTRQPLACGHYPGTAPLQSGVPTPQLASPSAGNSAAVATPVWVVGVWASCFRPEAVTVTVGDVLQWHQIDYSSPVIALANGFELGPVHHILEVRFNRPGRYAYRATSAPHATGTVVVEGQAGSGPELEVWSDGHHREVSQAIALADGCAVTRPTGSTPPGVGVDVSGVNYGNGKVWVSLYPEGRVDEGTQPDGSIEVKFGWWRGVHGNLVITGHRLDSPSLPARSYVPEGYGDQGFQSSVITFPTAGCWEITGNGR